MSTKTVTTGNITKTQLRSKQQFKAWDRSDQNCTYSNVHCTRDLQKDKQNAHKQRGQAVYGDSRQARRRGLMYSGVLVHTTQKHCQVMATQLQVSSNKITALSAKLRENLR